MPLRKSDRHQKERVVYDDDEPYHSDDYDRPQASRRVSRSAHEPGTAEAGRGYRRRDRYDDDISPPRPSARSRSVDRRPPPRGRHDSYDSYSDYSDSDDDRRRRRQRSGGRRRDSKVSGASTSRARTERRETDRAQIIQAAASAAVVAGAAEAWRMRHDKRPWQKKGTKVATAAASAAAIAAFRDPGSKDSSKKNAIQATLGGLLVNRLANGGR